MNEGPTTSEVTLRPAAPSDVPLLSAWDTRAHVIACTGADDATDWAAELAHADAWTEHLMALEDGRPVGVVQLIDPAREHTHYWGSCPDGQRALDIWIGEEADLGRGLGTRIMARALERCFADAGVTAVLIDPLASNVAAQRFYRRLGFAEVGPRRFGDDDCIVLRMDRETWLGRARERAGG